MNDAKRRYYVKSFRLSHAYSRAETSSRLFTSFMRLRIFCLKLPQWIFVKCKLCDSQTLGKVSLLVMLLPLPKRLISCSTLDCLLSFNDGLSHLVLNCTFSIFYGIVSCPFLPLLCVYFRRVVLTHSLPRSFVWVLLWD